MVLDAAERLRLFDLATARQRQRGRRFVKAKKRGWAARSSTSVAALVDTNVFQAGRLYGTVSIVNPFL